MAVAPSRPSERRSHRLATPPRQATGAREVTITNPDATKASFACPFTVNAGPTVCSPSTGSPFHVEHRKEALMSITGTGFVSGVAAGLSSLEFELVGELTLNSNTSLSAKVKSSGGANKDPI
jgi:hypothetical protein